MLFNNKVSLLKFSGWKQTDSCVRSKSKSELEEYFKPNNESRFTMLEMGKVLEKVSASVSEHFTTSPKQYTDATLLSAMETAGNTDYVEDSNVEKKDSARLQPVQE